MMNFLVKTIANGAALAVAVWLVGGITLTGANAGEKTLTLLAVLLLFGVVNTVVKPVVKLLALPLFIVTLGLIALVVNALMLMVTSWLADSFELGFHVDGFWPALLGGMIISVVAWALHLAIPDRD
ncbi:phage holin family protein [Streptomyces clavuligerus]|uniref:Membrane spanning protein n=1 Tax=Streptomyces clavuligerus TaxID=1901 RepID=B5GXC5_STRCL|nr:phage holin family protein [Streptomyces clavuligerus]ANW19291.1 hypothetical protein BB341_14215 [Streptomyces clavuligerus]AXU13893.1 phage holin family protein [Streptomyces clavuligerus]EDY50971.1 membrane protein [Streptomyces clavuligerus]EFG07941.1 Membrane spanning protein [Streptomyces clavuligerus]MBY6303862.1 phage holin family protein [Streptomyces clavuligerus]